MSPNRPTASRSIKKFCPVAVRIIVIKIEANPFRCMPNKRLPRKGYRSCHVDLSNTIRGVNLDEVL